MKCLVTGGLGFIGSHIVENLIKEGAQVRVLDNLFSGNKENLKHLPSSIEVLEGDVRDKKLVAHAVSNTDFVFHQAALKTVPDSFNNPAEYNEVNVQGTLNLLEESRKQNVKKLIYASSSSCYGASPTLPKKETDATTPVSPYGISKLAAEFYCHIYADTYKFPTTSLRYFNVFGPRQPEKDGYSPVIPKFISCILKDEQPPIYGDGHQTRDFTYIDNVVAANLLAMKNITVTGAFNVGNGKSNSLLDIINMLNKFLNKDIKPKHLPPQKGDVRDTLASLDSIKNKLGYKAQVSFEEGLKRTLTWFQQRSK